MPNSGWGVQHTPAFWVFAAEKNQRQVSFHFHGIEWDRAFSCRFETQTQTPPPPAATPFTLCESLPSNVPQLPPLKPFLHFPPHPFVSTILRKLRVVYRRSENSSTAESLAACSSDSKVEIGREIYDPDVLRKPSLFYSNSAAFTPVDFIRKY